MLPARSALVGHVPILTVMQFGRCIATSCLVNNSG